MRYAYTCNVLNGRPLFTLMRDEHLRLGDVFDHLGETFEVAVAPPTGAMSSRVDVRLVLG